MATLATNYPPLAVILATNYTPISIISVISLVGGYGGLWLLWRLVFSSKRTHDDTLDRARRVAALKAAERDQDAPEAGDGKSATGPG